MQHNIFSKSRFSKHSIVSTFCCYDNKFQNFLATLEIQTFFHKVATALFNSGSNFHLFLPSFDVFTDTDRELITDYTVNFLNILTPKKFVVITLKFELCGSTTEE